MICKIIRELKISIITKNMFPTHIINQQFFDIEVLKQDVTNKKFTDCKIIFVDQEHTIVVYCHKIILYSSSDYFRNSFLCGDTDQIVIKADDARIMRDVVMSFYTVSNINHYGYPEWEYLLKTFMCKNYLLLNNDETLLYNLKVPEYGFELLIQVLAFYDLEKNFKLQSVVRENLPTQYNLPEYLRNVIKKKNSIILCGPHKIDKWYVENKELLNTFYHDGYISSVSFDGILYVTVSGESIKLLNDNGDLIREIKHHFNKINSISISYNKKFIVLHESTMFHTLSTENGQLIRTVNHYPTFPGAFDTLTISHDDQKIAYVSNNLDVHILNVENGQLIHNLSVAPFVVVGNIQHKGAIYCITFTSNDKYVLACCFNIINIWDTESGLLIRSLNKTYPVYKLILSRDDRYMMMMMSSFLCDEFEVLDTIDQLPIWHKKNINFQFDVSRFSISNDNNLIAYQNSNGSAIYIYNVKNDELVTTLPQDGLLDHIMFV